METITTDRNFFVWTQYGIQIHSGLKITEYDWEKLKDGKFLTASLMQRTIFLDGKVELNKYGMPIYRWIIQ